MLKIRKLIKEPLLHFLIIGALIFIYYSYQNKDYESEVSYDIVIDRSDINRLASAYQMSWNSKPDSSTLQRLIEEEIKTEIYYREAQRLNLQHNDEIIRRRLRQKYEFLVKDALDQNEPSQEDIRKYHDENKDKYSEPGKVSFLHIYISADNRRKPEQFAKRLLREIFSADNVEEDYADYGDMFHLSRYQKEKTKTEISESFGMEFAETLGNSSLGWADKPIKSGFGYHLVKIIGYKDQEVIPFETIKDKVMLDWRDDQRNTYNASLDILLKDKYTIKVKYSE